MSEEDCDKLLFILESTVVIPRAIQLDVGGADQEFDVVDAFKYSTAIFGWEKE